MDAPISLNAGSAKARAGDWSLAGINAPPRTLDSPVGPELNFGRGWYVIGKRTVQVIERGRPGALFFVVVVLFPGRRIDLRFPPLKFSTLRSARTAAMEYLIAAGGGRQYSWHDRQDAKIDGATCGDVLALEALGDAQ